MKPDEKNGFRAKKKRFLVAILKLSHETGIRFFEPLDFIIHYHRTWKFAIRILKISQLNLDSLTKNRFSVVVLIIFDQNGINFFLIIDFPNRYIRTWKSANRILKIAQLVLVLLTKNRFSAAIFNFYDQTGSRFFEPIFFTNH